MEEVEQIASENLSERQSTNRIAQNISNCLDNFNLQLPDWILLKMIFPESRLVVPTFSQTAPSLEQITGYQRIVSQLPNTYEPLGAYKEGYFEQGELHGYGVWAYSTCIRIGDFDRGSFSRGIYISYDQKGNFVRMTIGEGTGDYLNGIAMSKEGDGTRVGYFHTGLQIGIDTDGAVRGVISKDEYAILKGYLEGLCLHGVGLPEETPEVTELRNTLKKRALFANIDERLEQMKLEGIIDDAFLKVYSQLHHDNPLRAKLLLPVLLDPRNDTKEKVEDTLASIVGDSEAKKYIDENNVEQEYGFGGIIEFYVSRYMTYDFVRSLSKGNPELFRKLYPTFGEKYIADHYPDSLKRFQEMGIEPMESSAFFQRTGSGDYHSFLAPRYIWQRAMFANLVEKLPKTQANVYRGIRFHSEDDRSHFLSHLDGINDVIANFTLIENVARDFASGGGNKQFGVELFVANATVHHLDGEFDDHEQHAWFEEGTRFRVKRIISRWEPFQVELEII